MKERKIYMFLREKPKEAIERIEKEKLLLSKVLDNNYYLNNEIKRLQTNGNFLNINELKELNKNILEALNIFETIK